MVAGADSRPSCPASGGISGCQTKRKKEMDKTGLSVLHKHIKEVPATMAVSLVHWGRHGLFFACAIFEMGLRVSRREPFSKQGNGKILKKR